MYKTYTKQICKESNILLKKTDPLLFVRREEGGGGDGRRRGRRDGSAQGRVRRWRVVRLQVLLCMSCLRLLKVCMINCVILFVCMSPCLCVCMLCFSAGGGDPLWWRMRVGDGERFGWPRDVDWLFMVFFT